MTTCPRLVACNSDVVRLIITHADLTVVLHKLFWLFAQPVTSIKKIICLLYFEIYINNLKFAVVSYYLTL